MSSTPSRSAVPPTNRHRRQRFAEEYAAVPNGTQAAIAAGYSPASAHVQASRLLRHPAVVVAIDAARRKAASELGLYGRASLERARADAVLALSAYWTLEPLPPLEPGGPARGALRLKLAGELSAAEHTALAPESFDADGQLVRIVLADAFGAVAELGRLAGFPGFEEAPAASPTGDEPEPDAAPREPAPHRRCPAPSRPAPEGRSAAADGPDSVDGESYGYRDPFAA